MNILLPMSLPNTQQLNQIFIRHALLSRIASLYSHNAPLTHYWNPITLQKFHYATRTYGMCEIMLHASKFTLHLNSCYVKFHFSSKFTLSLDS